MNKINAATTITQSSFLGTPEAWYSENMKVTCKHIQFLGGGIHLSIFTLYKDDKQIAASQNMNDIRGKYIELLQEEA